MAWEAKRAFLELELLPGTPAPLLSLPSLFPRLLLPAAPLGRGKDHSRRILSADKYLKPVWFGSGRFLSIFGLSGEGTCPAGKGI